MDDMGDIRTKLAFRSAEMDMQLRYVLQDVTAVLTEKDWERIEAELNRAIR